MIPYKARQGKTRREEQKSVFSRAFPSLLFRYLFELSSCCLVSFGVLSLPFLSLYLSIHTNKQSCFLEFSAFQPLPLLSPLLPALFLQTSLFPYICLFSLCHCT